LADIGHALVVIGRVPQRMDMGKVSDADWQSAKGVNGLSEWVMLLIPTRMWSMEDAVGIGDGVRSQVSVSHMCWAWVTLAQTV